MIILSGSKISSAFIIILAVYLPKAGIALVSSNKQRDILPAVKAIYSGGFNDMKFKTRFALVALIVLIMFILHNSYWLWSFDSRVPLLFGFMPFAFSFYVAYTFLAVLAMKVIIDLAWPDPPAEVIESFSAETGEK